MLALRGGVTAGRCIRKQDVPVSEEAVVPVGVGVDQELEGEDEGEEEVQPVGEGADLGGSAVGENHIFPEFRVEDADDEVLVGEKLFRHTGVCVVRVV